MDVCVFGSLDQCMKIIVESVSQREMLQWTTRTLKVLNEDSQMLLRSYEETLSHVSDLEAKLKEAQKLYYAEKQKLNSAIKDRNKLVRLLNSAKDVLKDDKTLHSGTRERLSFLNQPSETLGLEKLDPIIELNSTDCLMSELSYTQDEGDSVEESCAGLRRSKRHKRQPPRFPSDEDLDQSKSKRRKHRQNNCSTDDGNEQVIATTTVTVPHTGPVTATSVIQTAPTSSKLHQRHIDSHYLPSAPPMDLDTDNEIGRGEDVKKTPKRPLACQTNMRLHNWNQKSHIRGETCYVCNKKMKFSSVAVKCCNCKAVAHSGCKQSVPLPCVPVAVKTPTIKTTKPGSIEEYVPDTRPMVPALVVHCIREIEARGLGEVGLYRVPGSDKQVKTLKQQLLKAKGIVVLSDVPDIHAVCGCLKEFLRSLKEPLIPHSKWQDFAAASDIHHAQLKKQKILSILQSLPQPNRDTLAYITLHLQRVAASPDCKMPVVNLSKMFGPSIVGYYSTDTDNMYMETNISNKVMADFLLLPSECWEDILYSENNENQAPTPLEPVKTPSQSSLLGFFSNSTSSVKTVRKFKFFDTP